MIKKRGTHLEGQAGGRAYFSLILLLFLLQGQLYEHLLEFLVTVVDHELLKAIVLSERKVAYLRPVLLTAPPSLSHGQPVPPKWGSRPLRAG